MTKRKRARVLVLGHVDEPIERAGGVAVLAGTRDERALELIETADALLLTGGSDVNPALYDSRRHARTYGIDDARDTLELLVIDRAAERGIPIMGICRGAQLLNVAFGGTLYQHIPDLPNTHRFHSGYDHRVRVAKGSRLAGAVRVDEPWVVSLHHQAVDEVAEGFVATAWALDGTIEAVESLDGWMLGVQFHPEMTAHSKPEMQRIFNRFVRAAAKVAGLPAPKPRKLAQPKVINRTAQLASLPAPKKRTPAAERANWSRSGSTVTRWRCFRCRVPDFDQHDDYVDHMLMLHGVDLADARKLAVRS